MEEFINENYEFRYNVITCRPEFRKKTENDGNIPSFQLLDDYSFNSVRREIKNNHIKTSIAELTALLNSDFVPQFHPFRHYLENLEEWDGKDYIHELANCIKSTNQPYLHFVFKKWIVNMVACAYDENVTNQQVFILVGGQGIRKSTYIQNLLPTKLKTYVYSGKLNPSNKDNTLLLADKWLINMDDFGSFKKSQVEDLKELITKTKVTERRPYGRFTSDYTRVASFAGSTNETAMLTDETGNRRFLVVRTDEVIDMVAIDLDKVYGQAFHLFKGGFKYYFDVDDNKLVEAENAKYRQFSDEENLIQLYLEPPTNGAQYENTVFMNATELIREINLRHSSCPRLSSVNMGKALRGLNYKSSKQSDGINRYEIRFKVGR